jgi:hypothetical protein
MIALHINGKLFNLPLWPILPMMKSCARTRMAESWSRPAARRHDLRAGMAYLLRMHARPAVSGKACVLPLYNSDCLPCLKQTVDDAVISNLPYSPELGSERRGPANDLEAICWRVRELRRILA